MGRMGAEDPPSGFAAAPRERLNRFLARAGVASRRAADALIASGSVRVNGTLPPASEELSTTHVLKPRFCK